MSLGGGGGDVIRKQIELSVQARGQNLIPELDGMIQTLTRDIDLNVQAFRSGLITYSQFSDNTRRMIRDQADLTEQLRLARDALANGGTIVADAGARATAAARAFEDMGRGLGSIAAGRPLGALTALNSVIVDVARSSGMTGLALDQLTAATSVLTRGAYLLYTHWDDLRAAFKGSSEGMSDFIDKFSVTNIKPVLDAPEQLKKELKEAEKTTKELGDRTALTLSEFLRFEEAKVKVKELNDEIKRTKELEDLLSEKSEADKKRIEGFEKAVAGTGPQFALEQLRDALSRGADAKGQVFSGAIGDFGKKGTPEEIAGGLMVEARRGNEVALAEINAALKGAFGDNSSFARNLQKFDPKTEELKKAIDKLGDTADKMKESVGKTAETIEKGQLGVGKAAAGGLDLGQDAMLRQQGEAAKAARAGEAEALKRGAAEEKDAREALAKFGKPVQGSLAAFLTEQNMSREQLRQMKPADRRRFLREAGRESGRRRKELSALHRNRQYRKEFARLTPEEQAARQLQEQLYTTTTPMAADRAREFAAGGLANVMKAGGMPGAGDPQELQARAMKGVEMAQRDAAGLFDRNFAAMGNVLQAMQATQAEFVGQLGRHQQNINRLMGNQDRINRGVRDLRQPQQNIGGF